MGTDGFSKHATSPEALAHKVAYDTEYESNPERVKYREELNQERRKRHIMGHGGPDMSHTKTGHIVPEDMHTNRARHFKERGTLKSMDMAWDVLKKGAMSQVHQIIQDAPTPAHAIQEITNAYGVSHDDALNLIRSAMTPQ